jgi:hypothetical protein
MEKNFASEKSKSFKNSTHNCSTALTALGSRALRAHSRRPTGAIVVQLLGVIDLLRHIKDLSLHSQTVNVLPWEMEGTVSKFVHLMETLADELDAGRTNYTLPPTAYSNGKPVRAFEMLSLHLPQLQNGTLSMVGSDDIAARVDLKRQSETRQTASTRRILRTLGLDANSTIADEIRAGLKGLAGMARSVAKHLKQRLTRPPQEREMMSQMAKCLDFTQMITSDSYVSEAVTRPPLASLRNWLVTRQLLHGGESNSNSGVEPMPGTPVVWEQLCELSSRLRAASAERAYRHWKDASSSTVIMKSVFTEARFYHGCEDYLYLWLHMATKSMCEAVVEGMGGVWDRCDRQGNWQTAIEEAVIAWNAPKPYHPSAKAFINHSLNHWAGGEDRWIGRFNHQNKHHIERQLGKSNVIERKKREEQRLPSAFYDVSAL